jgi:hypothetical protein
MKFHRVTLTALCLGIALLLVNCSSASRAKRKEAISTVDPGEPRAPVEEDDTEWAREVPRQYISSPYSFSENLVWFKNNLFGPSKKHSELTRHLPQSAELNEISPQMTLGFIGDIMQMKEKELTFGEDLRRFLADADFLIGNFEGVISSAKPVALASTHSERTLAALASLFEPEKTLLGNANNHSGDFGWEEFNKNYQLQQDHGFLTVGRKDEPAILLDGRVNVAAVTKWSNQRCLHVAELEDIDAAFAPDAAFNILFVHWGYEMQLYPNPEQIQFGKDLLDTWDMIIGHHSHCPQPVTSYEVHDSRKVVAYSLGDFCTHLRFKKHRYGIVVKTEVGPDGEGNWKVGKIEWRYSFVEHVDEGTSRVELVDGCELFGPTAAGLPAAVPQPARK